MMDDKLGLSQLVMSVNSWFVVANFVLTGRMIMTLAGRCYNVVYDMLHFIKEKVL